MFLIIFLNGIYDITCGMSILFFPNFFFAKIHKEVFYDKYMNNDLLLRILAYWIITQGFIRLSNDNYLICISYLLEAFVFTYEYIYFKTVINYKTLWIVFTSLLLSIYSFF